MARYEHLPIYKTAMDLTVYLEQVVRNFSRYHKYTLGSDLRQQSRELVLTIIRANSRQEKVPVLHELRERLESLLVLLRIGQEVRAFQSGVAYGRAAELAVALSRQNEGWIKSQSKPTTGVSGSGLNARPDGQAGERAGLHHGASAPPQS
jgi:hypothetical protein